MSNNPRRILIISDAWEPQINGVVRTYQNLVRELRAIGHTVEVIGPDRFFTRPLPLYPEIRIALRPGRKLGKLIANFEPDILHIAVEGTLGRAARRYCLKNHLPFSTSFDTQFPDCIAACFKPLGNRAVSFVRRVLIHYVRNFHAPARLTYVATNSLRDQLRGWGFEQRLVVMARGVDMNLFHPGPSSALQDLPKPLMLYVGRVSVEKNLREFLDLNRTGSKIIVGDGPVLPRLRARYPDAVFTGALQGKVLADHYRASDVFVFPSLNETFGMVLIEALACGLPVAAHNVPGPRDIVTDASLGSLCASLQDAIASALQSYGGKDARFVHIRAHYSWRAVADAFMDGQNHQ